VAFAAHRPYLCVMTEFPAFLDSGRPDVPAIVTPRGVIPFHLPGRPVRGRLVRLGPLADALLTRHTHDDAVTFAEFAGTVFCGLHTPLRFVPNIFCVGAAWVQRFDVCFCY
jgi:molecular chaperone Hsp33